MKRKPFDSRDFDGLSPKLQRTTGSSLVMHHYNASSSSSLGSASTPSALGDLSSGSSGSNTSTGAVTVSPGSNNSAQMQALNDTSAATFPHQHSTLSLSSSKASSLLSIGDAIDPLAAAVTPKTPEAEEVQALSAPVTPRATMDSSTLAPTPSSISLHSQQSISSNKKPLAPIMVMPSSVNDVPTLHHSDSESSVGSHLLFSAKQLHSHQSVLLQPLASASSMLFRSSSPSQQQQLLTPLTSIVNTASIAATPTVTVAESSPAQAASTLLALSDTSTPFQNHQQQQQLQSQHNHTPINNTNFQHHSRSAASSPAAELSTVVESQMHELENVQHAFHDTLVSSLEKFEQQAHQLLNTVKSKTMELATQYANQQHELEQQIQQSLQQQQLKQDYNNSSHHSHAGSLPIASSSSASLNNKTRVKLNVGGTIFETTIETLMNEPDNYLSILVVQQQHSQKGPDHNNNTTNNEIFIDRNPRHFEVILDYLRSLSSNNNSSNESSSRASMIIQSYIESLLLKKKNQQQHQQHISNSCSNCCEVQCFANEVLFYKLKSLYRFFPSLNNQHQSLQQSQHHYYAKDISQNLLLSTSSDKTCKIWDLNTCNCISTLVGHEQPVSCVEQVCVNNNTKLIVTAGWAKTIRLFDISNCCSSLSNDTNFLINERKGNEDNNNCSNSNNGNSATLSDCQVLVAKYQLNCQIWCMKFLPFQFNNSSSSSSSSDTSEFVMAMGSDQGTILLINIVTGSIVHEFHGHEDAVTSLLYINTSNNCHYLLSGSVDCTIRVWNLVTMQCERIIRAHSSTVRSLCYAATATTLSPSKSMVNQPSQSASSWSSSNYSNCVISTSCDKTIKMFNFMTGALVLHVPCSQKVTSAAYLPHMQWIVSGHENGEMQVWDISQNNNGKNSQPVLPQDQLQPHTTLLQPMRIKTLEGHTSWIEQVIPLQQHKMSNTTLVASASDDFTIRIWDVVKGQCVNILRGHSDHVLSLCAV